MVAASPLLSKHINAPLSKKGNSFMFVKSAIDRLRYVDWTFSGTAEGVVALLLASLVILLVVTMLA